MVEECGLKKSWYRIEGESVDKEDKCGEQLSFMYVKVYVDCVFEASVW